MKATLLIAACLLSTATLHAQANIEHTWSSHGYNGAYSAAATTDGGYIISGLCEGADHTGDIIIIKTNAHADVMWTLREGGPLLEGGNYVMQTADGGYLVSGHTEDYGAHDCDAFLMKLSKEGTKQWLKVYGGDEDDIGEGVVELPGTEGFLMTGITASYGAPGNRHTYFVRTKPNGDTLWTRTYGGSGKEYVYSAVRLEDGTFLAAGFTNSWSAGVDNAWLLHLKADGDTLWARRYSTAGASRYHQIIPAAGGGFYLVGYTHASPSAKAQGLLEKLDAAGNPLWQRLYGDATEEITLSGIAQLPNGNLMLSGTNFGKDATGNAYALSTNAAGDKLSDALSGGSYSRATSIAAQGSSSYLIAGATAVRSESDATLYYLEKDRTIAGIPFLHNEEPTIFPNPASSHLTIMLPAILANQPSDIAVQDVRGALICTQHNDAGKDIQIASASMLSGPYFFRITSADGKVYKGRFVVKRDY